MAAIWVEPCCGGRLPLCSAIRVILIHSDVDSANNCRHRKLQRHPTALYFRFGAYIFFAISGYVIAKPWARNIPVPSHHEFFQRRAFRLLPAATLAIVCNRVTLISTISNIGTSATTASKSWPISELARHPPQRLRF